MELQNLGELNCSICFNLFGDGARCPRILSCGHSFCHSCLEKHLKPKSLCPTCNVQIKFQSADLIPINFIAKNIVSKLPYSSVCDTNSKKRMRTSCVNHVSDIKPVEKKPKHLPSVGFCEEHGSVRQFRCMDSEIWICGACIILEHKECRTLLVEEALQEMKSKFSKKVEMKTLERKAQIDHLNKFIKDLEEKNKSTKKEIKTVQLELKKKVSKLKNIGKFIEELQNLKSEKNKFFEELKPYENLVINSHGNEEFQNATNKIEEFLEAIPSSKLEMAIPRSSHCHLTIEDIRLWCKRESGVYAIRNENASPQYGKIKVKNNRIWVYSFKKKPPEGTPVIFSFRELLSNFKGSSKLPERAFLQLGDEKNVFGEIIIATDGLTPRSLNFLLLCSGISGRSYKGNRVYCYGSGVIRTVRSDQGEAVTRGIKDYGVYTAPMKKGYISGWDAEKHKNILSGFSLWMNDHPTSKLPSKFGAIESGLEVCEKSFHPSTSGSIWNCGLVI